MLYETKHLDQNIRRAVVRVGERKGILRKDLAAKPLSNEAASLRKSAETGHSAFAAYLRYLNNEA